MTKLPQGVQDLFAKRGTKYVVAQHSFPENPTDITARIFEPDVEDDAYAGPIWMSYRHGMSVTKLDDGRTVFIAGEHEDYYDPCFFIYNDVWVWDGSSLKIYGYPYHVFPATDFHRAILIGKHIWTIGALGYSAGSKKDKPIQVCRLDTETMKMELLRPTGDCPKWLWFDHSMCRGNVCELLEGRKIYVKDGGGGDEYVLDTDTLVWEKLQNKLMVIA